MADGTVTLRGEATSDERQLDGSRHLTIELRDDTERWRCTLHLIVGRDGYLHEAEVEGEGPDGPWSGALLERARLDAEGPLLLRARFGAPDVPGAAASLQLEEEETAGLFRLTLGGG